MTNESPPLRIGIVGCGNIAGPYARDLAGHAGLRLVGVVDRHLDRAQAVAGQVGCRAYQRLADLIDDADLVVNLTSPAAHAEITAACLDAGRHVYSEKPLALDPSDARDLVGRAAERGVRLGCAPATLLGEAQQTAWNVLRSGRLGPIRAVLADVGWGPIERWHPKPAPFYAVGPLSDVGVYPLSIITGCLGPVRKIWAYGATLRRNRVAIDGTRFVSAAPDFQVVVLELSDGTITRLTTSFYVGQQSKGNAAIEFHGDLGSLWLEHFFKSDARVELADARDDAEYAAIPLVRAAPALVDWARAVVDMAEAIADGRPHRASGEQAAHIVDVLAAAREATLHGTIVTVTSTFAQPTPMPWAS